MRTLRELLNHDLWENLDDSEYETFVLEVKNLIIPIMETIQEYGLKKRNLNKFTTQIEKFYTCCITDKSYRSDLVIKYQKRFIRYHDSLFTLLSGETDCAYAAKGMS